MQNVWFFSKLDTNYETQCTWNSFLRAAREYARMLACTHSFRLDNRFSAERTHLFNPEGRSQIEQEEIKYRRSESKRRSFFFLSHAKQAAKNECKQAWIEREKESARPPQKFHVQGQLLHFCPFAREIEWVSERVCLFPWTLLGWRERNTHTDRVEKDLSVFLRLSVPFEPIFAWQHRCRFFPRMFVLLIQARWRWWNEEEKVAEK